MEIDQSKAYLPLQLAQKYYKSWDCDLATSTTPNIYYKHLEGQGTIEFTNGNRYTGLFKNGLMDGKGVYRWKNGMTYEGEFRDNRLSGKGKICWADGSWYEGEVVDGRREGEGVYWGQPDRSQYKGSWKNNVKEGQGTLTFANGSIYQGTFHKGIRQGYGKMKYPSSNQYTGQWQNDKKQGQGTMKWHTTNEKYEGSWSKDNPHGFGSYFWFDGKLEHKIMKIVYKGNWNMGKREGFGSFFYSGGCRFQGYFDGGVKDGIGIVTDEFGDCKVENYKKDKPTTRTLEFPPKKQLMTQDTEQNPYKKYLDLSSQHLTPQIYNLLLRQNSKLRNLYKHFSQSSKQNYSGMILQNLWKMMRDLKMINQDINIARMNREFSRCGKYWYEIQGIMEERIKIVKENGVQNGYGQVLWGNFCDGVYGKPFSWENWNIEEQELDQKDLLKAYPEVDVHNNKKIVLYRHFITFIIQMAILQYQTLKSNQQNRQLTFKKYLEDLLQSLKHLISPQASTRTQHNVNSQNLTNNSLTTHKIEIASEYVDLNKNVFNELNKNKDQLLWNTDFSVSVRQLYHVLVETSIVKEPSEKMLFLERIQRNLSPKVSLLKKQNKANYSTFEAIVTQCSYFKPILNYELVETDFNEILFAIINRKVGNSKDKQEHAKKYKDFIKSILEYVEKVWQQNKNQKKCSLKLKKKIVTEKDLIKQKFLKKLELERLRKIEQQKKMQELAKEEKERLMMEKEDHDIDEEESFESQEYL